MTKFVVNNSEVAHLWAHQNQDHARGGGSISFRGRSLYSYSAEIARLVEDRNGNMCALHIDRSWSITTSAHQSSGRSATSHLPSFRVAEFDNPKANFENYRSRFDAALKAIGLARTNKDWKTRSAQDLLTEANDYASRFSIRARLKMPADVEAHVAGAIARERKRAALERKNEKERDREAWENWLAAKSDYCPRSYEPEGQVRLRVRADLERIESSKGAQCPIEHARLAFAAMVRCKAAGEGFKRNGRTIALGTFQVDEIAANGTLRAGCHTVAFSEGQRIAKELGWEV